MNPKRILLLILIAAISFTIIQSEDHKQTHPQTPIGIKIPPVKSRAGLPAQSIHIKGLKAVMLGGEVDGVNGPQTKNYLEYLRKIAATLRERGVSVKEFYSPTNISDIREALNGAHFVAYAGHGIGSVKPPKYHTPNPGGMLILKQVWVNSQQIKDEFKTHPNAIVILLGACFTAGNSGPDIGKINESEAKQRIISYTTPFMQGNFAGYYAAWSPYTGQAVLAHLFAGKNMGEAYEHGQLDKVRKIDHPNSSRHKLWYHITSRSNKPVFDYAFSGDPQKTLKDLFDSDSTDNADSDVDEPEITDEQNKFSDVQSQLLRKAIVKGDDDEAFNALEAKADPNHVKDSWSVLALSIYYNRVQIANKLIENKADVHFKVEGWSLLSLAEAYQRQEIFTMLEKAGATKNRSMHRSLKLPKLR